MSKKVRTLVDLEALLNDGAAYVLFKLLQASFQLYSLAIKAASLSRPQDRCKDPSPGDEVRQRAS